MYIICKYTHHTLSEEYLIPEVLPRKEAEGGGEGCQRQPECLERSRSEKPVERIFLFTFFSLYCLKRLLAIKFLPQRDPHERIGLQ